MKKTFSFMSRALAIFMLAWLLASIALAANSERVIYDFQSSTGANPWSSLVFGGAGNLYGTTQEGGLYRCAGGCGTVTWPGIYTALLT